MCEEKKLPQVSFYTRLQLRLLYEACTFKVNSSSRSHRVDMLNLHLSEYSSIIYAKTVGPHYEGKF